MIRHTPPAGGHVLTSYCRLCSAICGIRVTVAEGRAVKVVGDVENPLTRGYTCPHGRALPAIHNHQDRILHSLKRTPAGSFERIHPEQAMDEIAVVMADLLATAGPRAL